MSKTCRQIYLLKGNGYLAFRYKKVLLSIVLYEIVFSLKNKFVLAVYKDEYGLQLKNNVGHPIENENFEVTKMSFYLANDTYARHL